MKERFAAIFRTKTRDEWTAIFDGTDACVAPVLSPWEAHEHPHNVARSTYIEVDGAVQPAPAPRFSRTPSVGVEAAVASGGRHRVRAASSGASTRTWWPSCASRGRSARARPVGIDGRRRTRPAGPTSWKPRSCTRPGQGSAMAITAEAGHVPCPQPGTSWRRAPRRRPGTRARSPWRRRPGGRPARPHSPTWWRDRWPAPRQPQLARPRSSALPAGGVAATGSRRGRRGRGRRRRRQRGRRERGRLVLARSWSSSGSSRGRGPHDGRRGRAGGACRPGRLAGRGPRGPGPGVTSCAATTTMMPPRAMTMSRARCRWAVKDKGRSPWRGEAGRSSPTRCTPLDDARTGVFPETPEIGAPTGMWRGGVAARADPRGFRARHDGIESAEHPAGREEGLWGPPSVQPTAGRAYMPRVTPATSVTPVPPRLPANAA